MAPKDLKREDRIVPYVHVPAKPRSEATAMISQTMPMAAMFMRNKMLSWSSFFLAIQSYLNEPTNRAEPADQPPILKVIMGLVALLICYVEIIFPVGSPLSQKAELAKSATTAVAAATST